MSLVSSLVMVRVAAEVAFFTTFSVAEVFDFVCLPDTLLLTKEPTTVAMVDVTAVMIAARTFEGRPFFCLPPFLVFSSLAAAFSSSYWYLMCF